MQLQLRRAMTAAQLYLFSCMLIYTRRTVLFVRCICCVVLVALTAAWQGEHVTLQAGESVLLIALEESLYHPPYMFLTALQNFSDA